MEFNSLKNHLNNLITSILMAIIALRTFECLNAFYFLCMDFQITTVLNKIFNLLDVFKLNFKVTMIIVPFFVQMPNFTQADLPKGTAVE